MSTLTTRSPYLRNRLLEAADGLRKDAETARLNLAEAEADVAAARQLLAEAEAQEKRARAEVDSITHDITWLEEQADHHTIEPADDPAAKLKATGLMRHEPKPPRVAHRTTGRQKCEDGHEPMPLPFNVVQAPADVVAVLTGSHPTIAPDTSPCVQGEHARCAGCDECPQDCHPAGVVVATHGPGVTAPLDPAVTAPDAGLAHPVPNPAVLPAEPCGTARHAKPKGSRLTGGFRALITRDEQDGDKTDG